MSQNGKCAINYNKVNKILYSGNDPIRWKRKLSWDKKPSTI